MTDFGPHNPHPLSNMKTELIWEGKYDEFGNRRETSLASLALPLQRIETIDEPRSRAQAQGALFDERIAHRDDFRNLLIWGDNKLVMASLLRDFEGKIDLIYIDPPFDVGADFSMKIPLGEDGAIQKEQSLIEMIAYRDTWGHGVDSYVNMMFDRIVLLKHLLAETGNFYIHTDRRVVHLIRAVCDEIFGGGNLRNEIIWCYRGGGTPDKAFAEKHDTILRYSKSDQFWFNVDPVRIPYSGASAERLQHQANVFRASGIYTNYKPNELGKHPEDWWAIQPIMPSEKMERVDYPTQKPVELLQKIIDSSCPEEGIVLDVFCGSGTAAAVAEGLRVKRDPSKPPGSDKYLFYSHPRRWIACDLGRFAIHTTRKRMIGIQRELHHAGKQYRSFDVHNLGRYERQWWQKEHLKGADEEHRNVVLRFFRAEVLSYAPSILLHGRRGTAFVHVDGIDSILSRDEVVAVAQAVSGAGGREVHCLAWDFEMDIRQVVSAVEADTGVRIRLHRIPREIMEKNRTEVPPFFEIAFLEAKPVYRMMGGKGPVNIKLTNFLPSLSEVPSKELEVLQEQAITSGFDFIDFWAVDFDWQPGKPFNHHWQDYRTRKDRTLKMVSDADYVCERSGKHTACVKVVDVFGCDTSITVEIET